MATLDDLFDTLSRRPRPEDVSELIRQHGSNSMTARERTVLLRAARGALARSSFGFSSMSSEFRRPVGLQRQVATARDLFPTIEAPSDSDCDRLDVLGPYIASAGGTISKGVGENSFKEHRLNRSRRSEAGLGELSKRQYNKRFRLLSRMERKLETLEREIRKREFTLVSKSRLATRIAHEDFVADADTAYFIAYLTARANLRSVFTNGPQDRAYDEIAEMLFRRCRQNPGTNWWAIAHVHTDREVLEKLSDAQRGKLLATWYGLLCEIASLLEDVWKKSRFDRSTMIVKRGDDSTTWNATAGAWNKAREGWIGVVQSLEMDPLLDELCPGKVLRLMAADVAFWHRISGGGLEPDTAVWAELPPPWEVLQGKASCGRTDVEAACRRHGVDAVKKGWVALPSERKVATFRPTPELVHGVEVGHPALAVFLRKCGAFSGKTWKQPRS